MKFLLYGEMGLRMRLMRDLGGRERGRADEQIYEVAAFVFHYGGLNLVFGRSREVRYVVVCRVFVIVVMVVMEE